MDSESNYLPGTIRVRSAADETAQHTFRTANASCQFCLRNLMRFH